MSYVFFTDRDLGKRLPQTLLAAGLMVEAHDDHFTHDTPDEEWLAAVGKQGWYALTHNKRIRYTPNQIQAVLEHKVGLFVLVGAAPFPTLAENFVQTLDQVFSFIANNNCPFIAKIYRPACRKNDDGTSRPGTVSLWL